MIRFIFALMISVHGLIHVLGFVKAYNLANVSQLTQAIGKSMGLFWLLAAIVWMLTAGLLTGHKDAWWMVAIPALLLSQLLIGMHWQDAKFGTTANVIIALGVLLGYADWDFKAMVNKELKAFQPTSLSAPKWVTPESVGTLPAIVQKWLYRSQVVGKEAVQVVELVQKGEMKTEPDGHWIPFDAEQYNTIVKPGFIWQTRIQMMPLVPVVGRDKYIHGHGNMLIKALALFPIADAKGPAIDRGSLLRNLAEICWFPAAALRDYIHWEPLDSLSAKATMTNGGISASGIFRFTPAGDMESFEAKRYYDRKDGATLEDWLVTVKGYKVFNGVRIGHQSEVTWKLKTGDYTWLKLEITEIHYNNLRH